jgi:2-haloalkanoic acid dehalogenase type II
MDPVPYVADIEAYWASPPVHPDAIEMLQRVNVPICCVSNADTAPLLSAIARVGVHFDHVVASEAVRCYKPDSAIFQNAVDRLGVQPSRAIHVGDSKHSDIGGAARLGITTAWICRDDRIHDIGVAEPHHTIRTLTELCDLL